MANNDVWTSIEKLKGNENDHTWSFAVRTLLELHGLEKCIIDGENGEKDAEKIKKANARITLSVCPSIYAHIQMATTAEELWTKLKVMFQDSGLVRRIGLLCKLTTIRLETSSMNDYVTQITETANKLNGIGFPVDDEWLSSILLAGLTDEYKPLILGLESSGIPIRADTVKSKLIDVAMSTSKDSAFFGKRNVK